MLERKEERGRERLEVGAAEGCLASTRTAGRVASRENVTAPSPGRSPVFLSFFFQQGLWELWETRSVFQVLWEGAKQLSTGRQLP